MEEIKKLTLVDNSSLMVDQCKLKIPGRFNDSVEVVCSAIEKYNPEDEFDVVLCMGVLSHVRSIPFLVKKISSFVKEGGFCLVHITDWGAFLGKFIWCYATLRDKIFQEYGYGFNKIDRSTLIEIARSEKLNFVKECRFCHPLPSMTRFFSDDTLIVFQAWTMRVKFLSSINSDAILMFRKDVS